jgi:NAD(P)-dependent dehydrogenase (short-subunit alcohol dehydrogenase family)
MSSTKQQRVIIVTAANKGIGLELVKKLAKESPVNNNVILLGSRDLKRGQDALVRLGSPPNIHLLQFDISSEESIARATDEIKSKYSGQLNVIINNAAIGEAEVTVNLDREMFCINYSGIKTLNEHLFPLIQENGRVINVTSGCGPILLYEASKDLQEKYSLSTLTIEELDRLVEDFILAIERNSLEELGYNPK